jgi:sec-independent protein translocase protein TatB
MIEIGWGKLLLIGIVALLVIGPKELPAVLRAVGQWMTKLRRMAAEFQSQFQEAMREAELAELKKQVDEMSNKAQSYTNIDPLGDVRRELETTQRQIEGAVTEPESPSPKSTSREAPPAEPTAETQLAVSEAQGVPGAATEPLQNDREGKPA